MGFALMVQMASSNTILQTIVEEDKRGRVMSFYATAFLGLAPGCGALADRRPAGGGWFALPVGRRRRWPSAAWRASLAAAVFAWQLAAIREHIRPIYRRIGILPEVARGIQTASDPRTGVVAVVPAEEG